jgi:hypothetical protein
MSARSVLLSLAFAACSQQDGTDGDAADDGGTGPTDGTHETDDGTHDTDVTGDTDEPTNALYGEPTVLDTVCVPENALAFTCTVTVDPPQPVQITFVRTDGVGVTRTFSSDLVAGAHTIPLYYMGPDHDYTLDTTAIEWPDHVTTTTVTTGQPPFDVGSWLVMTGTSTMGLIGTESACDGSAVATIYDTETGELVWYRNLDPTGGLGILDMVRFTDDHTIVGETNGRVVEIDLLGNDLARFDVGYGGFLGLHHDIYKWNDQFYVMFQDEGAPGLTLDTVVILDMQGTELAAWEPIDHLAIDPAINSNDYLHTNSIYVDAAGDLYLNFLNQASVSKMNGDHTSPDFGQVQWTLTGDAGANDIGFDIDVDWDGIGGPDGFGFEHNMHLRNDGRLMLLDNDNGRGLVFTVDEVAKTAVVDASYDTYENSCGPQGTAMDTKAGNAVVACDTEWVREYDLATAAMIWEGELSCRNGGQGGFGGGVSATRWYPLDSW